VYCVRNYTHEASGNIVIKNDYFICGQEFDVDKKLRVCRNGYSASGTHAAMVSFILIEMSKMDM